MDQEPSYSYKPTDEMVKIVQERKPEHVYKTMPTRLRNMIQQKQDIPLAPESIWHFKRGAAPWSAFGTSLI
ncbi:hypothetical protein ACSTK0_24720, partial [Vibrio parahaemolyticus]